MIIVGGAGGGVDPVNLGTSTRGGGYSDWQTPATFGGGGQGGSISSWAGGYALGRWAFCDSSKRCFN